jgi:hypothetical protein
MSIRKAIYDLLNDSEADVYPLIAPQELTDPYVVYSMRRTPVRTQDGVTVNDVELSLSIYANSLSDCIGLADTMYSGLEGTTGTYATETLMISNWNSEDGYYIEGLKKYMITQEYTLRFT